MQAWLAALIAQTAGPGAPTSIDLTVYGVAGSTIAILLALLWAERTARAKAEANVVELATSATAGLTEAAAAMHRSADATRDLTNELRERGRR